jgi:hypothetical protein
MKNEVVELAYAYEFFSLINCDDRQMNEVERHMLKAVFSEFRYCLKIELN